jgi:hypothetical protein
LNGMECTGNYMIFNRLFKITPVFYD